MRPGNAVGAARRVSGPSTARFVASSPERSRPLAGLLRRLGPAPDELPAPDPPPAARAAGDVGEHDRHPPAGPGLGHRPPRVREARPMAAAGRPRHCRQTCGSSARKSGPGSAGRWNGDSTAPGSPANCRPLVERLPEPPVAITTMPTAADLVGELPVAHWVYYCVDDFAAWPGIDQAAAERSGRPPDRHGRRAGRGERAVVRADRSPRPHGPPAHARRRSGFLGETADVQRILTARLPACAHPSATCLPRHYIVFWGLIDRRLDLDDPPRTLGDRSPTARSS